MEHATSVRVLLNANADEALPNDDATTVERVWVRTLSGGRFFVKARGWVIACGAGLGFDGVRPFDRGLVSGLLGDTGPIMSDLRIEHPAIGITGRALFTLIFFLSGITHFTGIDDYVRLMPEAIPWRTFWVLISGGVELVGAGLILTNRYPRLGAWLIVLFLVPVTITVHGFEMVTNADAQMRAIQLSFFLKGLAMTGSALLITQLGVTPRAIEGGAGGG